MSKNPLMKYEQLQAMLLELKEEAGTNVIDIKNLRKAIALNFNIIDYVAQKRFLISLDKLGLIDGTSTAVNKVKICL